MIELGQRQAARVRILILLTGLLTSLAVWMPLADPINLPKMFVLTILSAWIFGSVMVNFRFRQVSRPSLGHWAILISAASILLAGLLTDVRYSAFFGEIQRNDGAFSYLALASLMFAAMVSFGSSDARQVRKWILLLGLILSIYGLLQTFGHDPLKWVLLYNHVVGTLGNPDFFSGIVGAAAIASVWLIIVEEDTRFRSAGFALLLLELFVLKRCGSIQGVVAFAMGTALLVLAKLWQINKKVGIISCTMFAIVSIPVALGLTNSGPLARYVYRGSFRNRVDYWHAAWSMFKAHPLFGVGLERFGQNYGQYAPQLQVVQGQGTDNAHNVFLQLLATGGLLIILPYLFLLAVIFISAVRGIRDAAGRQRIDLVALLSIWFALLLISFISIDNLGVAVWFWIIGGALYGASGQLALEKMHNAKKQENSSKQKLSESSDILSPIVSLVLSILMLVVMVPAWRSSSMLLALQRRPAGWTQAQYEESISRAVNVQPSNIQIKAQLALISLNISATDLGLQLIKSINQQDKRSIDGNYLGASAYEYLKKYELALPYRLRLLELDPWNTRNMLQLVTDYVAVRDFVKAREMALRLSHLYPTSGDTVAAMAMVKG